jgi:trehalose utilization protein
MHTSYKELNNGHKKRRDIKPRTKSSNIAATINRDPRIQNKMNQEQEQNHGIE